MAPRGRTRRRAVPGLRAGGRVMPPAGRPDRFPDGAVELLSRLTVLSQELASAYRPTTVVEIVARALTDVLAPAQLTIVLLDPAANHLTVAYELGGGPTRTDDPLLHLARARGPLVLPPAVAARRGSRSCRRPGRRPWGACSRDRAGPRSSCARATAFS